MTKVFRRRTARSRRRTILLWSAVSSLGALTVLLAVSLFILRPQHFKARAERELSERLGLDVTIESISLSFMPRPRLSGTKAVLRMPSRPELPPFISVERFWVEIGPLSAIRGHVKTLHLGGLRIAVPPGGAGDALSRSRAEGDRPRAPNGGDVIVDHVETENAVLTILRNDPNKPHLEFTIHTLSVNDAGFDRLMPFAAVLTNPVPEGRVASTGTIGPWKRGDPANLPLSGRYQFTSANLDTIKGIGGTLTSDGTYEGRLTEIRAVGRTVTPNFTLDTGDRPVPLAADFRAVVNGTNGTTTLEEVDATLFNSSLKVTGLIENLPGPGGHDIALDVVVTDGRIEDLLTLVVDSPTPLLTGDVTMHASVGLPPGPGKVRDRLTMRGRFGLDQAQFSGQEIQSKLRELSRRSRGMDQDEEPHAARVMTHLAGRFSLGNGVLRLSDVAFAVPGAIVALDGRYGLASGALDFQGTLRMQASLSEAVGGFRSVFVKPFNRLFRRKDAGTVVPIRITGTRARPKFGVRVGAIFTRSESD